MLTFAESESNEIESAASGFYLITCGPRTMKFGPADFGYVLALVAKLRAAGAEVSVQCVAGPDELN